MDFDKRNWLTYYGELGGALLFYFLLLVGTGYVFSLGVPAPLKVPLALVPMAGFVVGIWAVIRMFKRVDELQRQYMLYDLAVAFAVTAFVTFSYGFLEQVGFPKLSMFWVWGIMGGSWTLIAIYNRFFSKC